MITTLARQLGRQARASALSSPGASGHLAVARVPPIRHCGPAQPRPSGRVGTVPACRPIQARRGGCGSRPRWSRASRPTCSTSGRRPARCAGRDVAAQWCSGTAALSAWPSFDGRSGSLVRLCQALSLQWPRSGRSPRRPYITYQRQRRPPPSGTLRARSGLGLAKITATLRCPRSVPVWSPFVASSASAPRLCWGGMLSVRCLLSVVEAG